MPRIAKVIKDAFKAQTPKEEPKTPKAPKSATKCDNCQDSGMTCSVCRTGYDV